MTKEEIIKELSKLESRSMWDSLIAFRFKEGKNYTEMDLNRAYLKGLRDMNEIWEEKTIRFEKEIQANNIKLDWEILPVFPSFKRDNNYTEIDLTEVYNKGLMGMEKVWHTAVTELKDKIKSEDKPK